MAIYEVVNILNFVVAMLLYLNHTSVPLCIMSLWILLIICEHTSLDMKYYFGFLWLWYIWIYWADWFGYGIRFLMRLWWNWYCYSTRFLSCSVWIWINPSIVSLSYFPLGGMHAYCEKLIDFLLIWYGFRWGEFWA